MLLVIKLSINKYYIDIYNTTTPHIYMRRQKTKTQVHVWGIHVTKSCTQGVRSRLGTSVRTTSRDDPGKAGIFCGFLSTTMLVLTNADNHFT